MAEAKERSLFLIKPDGIQRGLIGEIISRIERTGLKFVAFKMLIPDEDKCWKHYNKDDAWFMEKGERTIKDRQEQGLPVEKEAIEYGKDILRGNVELLTSGPLLAMVIEGNEAVSVVKKLVGDTESYTSPVGTIRGDLSTDSFKLASESGRALRNTVHCSDSPAEGQRETALWFDESELMSYNLLTEKLLGNDLSEILGK